MKGDEINKTANENEQMVKMLGQMLEGNKEEKRGGCGERGEKGGAGRGK